jgi:predicted extracellular nuclease
MENVKVLDHKSKKDGDKVIVTKTVEESLTQQDIFNLKHQLKAQKENVLQQIQQMQERVSLIETQEQELDSYLTMLQG